MWTNGCQCSACYRLHSQYTLCHLSSGHLVSSACKESAGDRLLPRLNKYRLIEYQAQICILISGSEAAAWSLVRASCHTLGPPGTMTRTLQWAIFYNRSRLRIEGPGSALSDRDSYPEFFRKRLGT